MNGLKFKDSHGVYFSVQDFTTSVLLAHGKDYTSASLSEAEIERLVKWLTKWLEQKKSAQPNPYEKL